MDNEKIKLTRLTSYLWFHLFYDYLFMQNLHNLNHDSMLYSFIYTMFPYLTDLFSENT